MYLSASIVLISQENIKGGAGLGLSIASQIAQSHKIKLSVTSDEKQGTEFTLNF